jgi:hypothetical protein
MPRNTLQLSAQLCEITALCGNRPRLAPTPMSAPDAWEYGIWRNLTAGAFQLILAEAG